MSLSMMTALYDQEAAVHTLHARQGTAWRGMATAGKGINEPDN